MRRAGCDVSTPTFAFDFCFLTPLPTPHPASADSSAPAIAFLPLRYGPVTLPRFLRDLLGRAAGDDLAAEAAGAGAEVEQAVGAGDHFAVVLDDEQRVAQVAQFLQRGDAAGVLSRGCRPIVGSSSTYSTPHRPLPTWLARRMRWASPPESVGAARPSVR